MRKVACCLVLAGMFAGLACAESPKASMSATGVDPQSVYDDIEQTLGIVPTFLKDFAPVAIEGAWSEMKSVQLNPSTQISPQYKELIGLSVASQIPCHYCAYFHTEAAKLNGAQDEQVKEAIAIAASARHWSTYLNGSQTDMTQFRKDVDHIMKNMEAKSKQKTEITSAQMAANISTPAEAYKDIENTFGFVPHCLQNFPKEGIVGAWKEMKSLELNPNTAIPSKYKSLMSLAIASQIPCDYCIYFDTASAKADGATETEIQEAIAMGAITRHWSTVLNGSLTDYEDFQKETRKILSYVKEKSEEKMEKQG